MASRNLPASRSIQPFGHDGKEVGGVELRRLSDAMLLAAAKFFWNMSAMMASTSTCGDSGSSSAARLLSAMDSSNRPVNASAMRELIVREGVVRVELDRPPEFALATVPVEFVDQSLNMASDVCASAELLSSCTAFSAAALAFGRASEAVMNPSL